DAVGTNLAEHPRSPERAVPPEEPTLQGPDLMGHGSIEAPDLGDLVHYLTLVRYFPGSKRTASAGLAVADSAWGLRHRAHDPDLVQHARRDVIDEPAQRNPARDPGVRLDLLDLLALVLI